MVDADAGRVIHAHAARHERERVTERGPYRRVRHPGYLGSLLVWAGFVLTSGSPAVVATVAVVVTPAYVHRIDAEERLLDRDLPGYQAYRGRMARLVPRAGEWGRPAQKTMAWAATR